MRRLLLAGAVIAIMAAPASATAKPNKTDRGNAAQECSFERGSTAATREAFRVRYGTGSKRKNAFKKCVSRRARTEESQRRAAQTNAAQECRMEQTANPLAFAVKYGTNVKYPNPYNNNAFGKCVSGKAKAKERTADMADVRQIVARRSAAKGCAGLRKSMGQTAFANRYGSGRSKRRNAFGRCVSARSRAILQG